MGLIFTLVAGQSSIDDAHKCVCRGPHLDCPLQTPKTSGKKKRLLTGQVWQDVAGVTRITFIAFVARSVVDAHKCMC